MDQTPLQQTVMDPTEILTSSPQEVDSISLGSSSSAGQASAEQAYEPLSYDELFPALPNATSAVTLGTVVEPSPSNWTKNSNMRIASTVITQVFRVPYEERAKIDSSSQFGESASSRICTDITAKTGAHIEISSAKDQSLTFLVTGKNESVLRARRLILEKFQTLARQCIQIPKDHHRFILGKKGKKLQELEVSTATKIQVPNANDSSEDLYITGTKEGIEKAVHEIRLISDERSKQAYEKMEIPKMFHPFISGANNEKINMLMEQYRVQINMPPPSVMKNELTIAGEKEGVLKCMDIITQIYNEMKKKCQTVSVEVKKSQHKYVIGPKGSNIAEILHEHSVSVEIPPPESVSDTITLRGPPEKLGQALTMVYAKANSVITAEVDAPNWLHKFIIGRKGANIRQITQDLPKVHVEFSDKHGSILLEGPPEEVDVAKKKLEATIDEMKTRLTFEELSVDPNIYKQVMGKNGARNRIRNQTGVVISMTEIDAASLVRIEGNRQGVEAVREDLIALIAKLENEKERDIIIEQRLHRTIIGTKGDKIREIREKFNQVQISFPDPGEKSDIVKIRGLKDEVDACYRYLQRLVKELQESNFQLHVSVYRQFHKFIIGKSGANINKIREETNTRIEFPTDGNSDDITITGKREDCDKAKEMIQKIQNEMANIVEVDIMIPAKFHNSIIGAQGKLIQSISEECGNVSIKFPPQDSHSDKVTIRGPKEDVQKAKQVLVGLSNEKQEASFTGEVRAKPQHHRFLIGRNGVNIRKVRDETGARIIFPTDQDEDKELITIIGRKENVVKAREKLEKIIKELDKLVEDTITIDPKHHRHFVARRGEVVRQISEHYGGVTVSFPRPGVQSDKVTLKGAYECVGAAKLRIMEIIGDLEQMITLEVVIPQKYHRTVMGARGNKVQAITSEFDVTIKFPEKDTSYSDEESQLNGEVNGDRASSVRPQDIVRIVGKQENCESAKRALLDLVPITIKVEVPFKHHRFIIGQKGDNVRAMMTEHDVNIQVPPAHEQSDVICITGPAANVESAKLALEEKVKQLQEDELDRIARSFQLKLEIDPEYHPKIIGRKGAVISKIREKYDVNIQFPQRGEPDENQITIMGYEKNVYEARGAILSITGELDNMIKNAVEIDSSVHSRLIGAKGRAIRKVMEDYKVEVKFPRGGDDPNTVIIMGAPDAVEDCTEYLLNLAEEYMQDIVDKAETEQYLVAAQMGSEAPSVYNPQGFIVKGAPWAQVAPNVDSSEDFPSMSSSSVAPAAAPVWGPRR